MLELDVLRAPPVAAGLLRLRAADQLPIVALVAYPHLAEARHLLVPAERCPIVVRVQVLRGGEVLQAHLRAALDGLAHAARLLPRRPLHDPQVVLVSVRLARRHALLRRPAAPVDLVRVQRVPRRYVHHLDDAPARYGLILVVALRGPHATGRQAQQQRRPHAHGRLVVVRKAKAKARVGVRARPDARGSFTERFGFWGPRWVRGTLKGTLS
mmetsp:Transcript_11206/g.34084  ORF Transcript_11206/g.34084 Transcript_11206/m.34084 type:complete len:212 (+) Transcript_11206:1926-2561(+)